MCILSKSSMTVDLCAGNTLPALINSSTASEYSRLRLASLIVVNSDSSSLALAFSVSISLSFFPMTSVYSWLLLTSLRPAISVSSSLTLVRNRLDSEYSPLSPSFAFSFSASLALSSAISAFRVVISLSLSLLSVSDSSGMLPPPLFPIISETLNASVLLAKSKLLKLSLPLNLMSRSAFIDGGVSPRKPTCLKPFLSGYMATLRFLYSPCFTTSANSGTKSRSAYRTPLWAFRLLTYPYAGLSILGCPTTMGASCTAGL
ncbi:hypothetical protein MBAV_002124 [Candidatus Magnetobacterium bavaricum]|uniref:Uncharacterized protein n=1 Tax=Candidatus Magnetobacterium bavaricum TaxID=29290 RepID=A0A0F3GUX8_9BACT|nr:hypothetical protein MBAV_002124 [Candidatus Magnetobacterium bavaricum]